MSWFQPARPLLPDIIELNARWRGRLPALVCDGESTDWATLAWQLRTFGSGLRALGVPRGGRVVILMQNSPEMLVAMLGSACNGLVAVPLNVAVPDDAIATLIRDCDAAAIVASDEHIARIEAQRQALPEAARERLIGLGELPAGWRAFADVAAEAASFPALAPDDECNIIYSSGTTGLPKGIVHSHECRVAWAQDLSIALRYHTGARTLLSLGLYSNITWVALLNTILCGGTLYLERRFDAGDCLAVIEEERITHFAMVPVQFQRLLEHAEFDRRNLDSIAATMCCGSPLRTALKQDILARLPGDFIELYGLTEGLITIQEPADAQRFPDSVGRPCPGQDICILGSDDQPLPAGEAGEIAGFGRMLMSGYLNRDDANDDATWLAPDGRRWLRTGDIGRIDEHGNLYLVDRKKDMIISGGQNIYPADIEAVVARHPMVRDVAVIGVASERWGETPIAVVVAHDDTDVEALKAWTNERVGKQQRISAVRRIAELPRNPNGKVLKRELRRQFADLVL